MSRTGDFVASAVETGLWLTAAALIASSAGVRMPAGVLATPVPATAAPTGDGSPIAIATPTSTTLAPTPTPKPAATLSPIVAKFQAYLARKDFQFVATGKVTIAMTAPDKSVDASGTVSQSYRAGDYADTTKLTAGGVSETVGLGAHLYRRSGAGPWIDQPRSAADRADETMLFSAQRLFVDTGIEQKNGASLHRLEVADPVALSAEVEARGTSTNVSLAFTFWVKADGTPVVVRMDGAMDQLDHGNKVHVTQSQELTISRLSGVKIAAPKNPWQWIVDKTNGIAFGLPSNWKSSDINKFNGGITYADGLHYTLGYVTSSWPTDLDAAVAKLTSDLADPVEGKENCTVGGVPAVHFRIHRTVQKDYDSEYVFVRDGKLYQVLVLGVGVSDAATDSLAAQIVSSLTFAA
jgi:hypothetical protein